MSYNDKKILQVLLDELKEVPEQYEGYHEELKELLADVLYLERGHTIVRTTIVKKIADQVNTVGMSLYKSRVASKADEGEV